MTINAKSIIEQLTLGTLVSRATVLLMAQELERLQQPPAVANHETGALCCPFCSSTAVSDGEILSDTDDGVSFVQSECQECFATGPRAYIERDEVDYGDVKAVAAWNRREAKP